MKIATEKLLQDLIVRTEKITLQVQNFEKLPEQKLNWKQNAKSWSILECMEHLNLYGDFYLPEIKKCIENSKSVSQSKYTSGFLGNYFAMSLLTKEKLNKMKTFQDKNPCGSKLNTITLERFIDQQQQLLHLLNESRTVNLKTTKTAISISKWITLQLGDTFRIVIYHNERHLEQANKTLQLQKNL